MTATRPAVGDRRQVAGVVATALGLAVACALLAAVHLPNRPATLCLVRATTGLPCPLCGGTTAAVALGSLDPVGALRANPFAVVVGFLVVAGPLGVARGWARLPYRARTAVISTVLIGSELWQLHRVGLLG